MFVSSVVKCELISLPCNGLLVTTLSSSTGKKLKQSPYERLENITNIVKKALHKNNGQSYESTKH